MIIQLRFQAERIKQKLVKMSLKKQTAKERD